MTALHIIKTKKFINELEDLYKDRYVLYKYGAFDHGWTPILWWHYIRHL